MNRIGFAATYGFSSIDEAIEFAGENGFNAVEINLNIPAFFPEEYGIEDREVIKKMARDNDIILTFHAPEDLNLCSKQRCIVDASVKRLKECIDFACTLGGSRFTFHIGDSVVFTMYDRSLPLEDYYEAEYEEIVRASMEKMCNYASERITLCAENTGYFSRVKMKAIESLLGKGLYLTWDMGHSFIKKNQQEFMLKNICYVKNTHIHDVCKGKDHCIIGTGEMDIPYLMTLPKGDDVTCIIEVRPSEAAVESLNNLKKMARLT